MSDVVEEIVYRRCCGLDIHKEMIVACMINNSRKEVKTFSTMTDGLLVMAKWLKDNKIQMTAMESTGSYWKPIFNILESEEVPAILVNSRDIKTLRGRKTDVKDAEWIASLLKHGLLKASFVPKRDMRELRELVKYRSSLKEDSVRTLNRIEKILQGANIKLSSVISKTGTKTELSIIEALSNGVSDRETLSKLAQGTLKSKESEIIRALNGLIGEHQRLLLRSMYKHLKQIHEEISVIEAEIDKRMLKDAEIIERLEEIPGVGKVTAQSIIAEIGTNMEQFPSADHLSSWAGVCPGQNDSAGKRKSGKTRKVNSHLKKTLVQCANSASHTKDTYLSAEFKRISARRGRKRALVALAHTILIICYVLIKEGVSYQELGANYFDKRDKAGIIKRSLKRLEALGYEVTIKPKVA